MKLAEPSFRGFPFPSEDDAGIPTNGLALWLDATYGITLDGASTRVAAWAPRAGAASAVQPTTAAMPTLSTMNGLPALQFDGVDDALNIVNPFTVGDTSTCFVVFRVTDLSLSRPLFTASSNGAYSLAIQLSGVPRIQATGGAFTVGTGSPATVFTMQPTILTASFDRNNGGPGPYGFRVNRNAGGSGLASVSSFTAASDRIGSQSGAKMSGTIAELLVYQRRTTLEEVIRIENYLGSKWSIS